MRPMTKKFLTLTTLVALLGGSLALVADDDYEREERKYSIGKRYERDGESTYRMKKSHEKEKEKSHRKYDKEQRRTSSTASLRESQDAELYRQECSACHMAYQPEFLPRRSWAKMMRDASLRDHFGTDATLEETDRRKIARFLEANAAASKPEMTRPVTPAGRNFTI